MPRSSSLSLLFWLLACTPGVMPGGSDGSTDTSTGTGMGSGSTTGDPTTGLPVSTGTGTGTTADVDPSTESETGPVATTDPVEPPVPDGPFQCPGARWLHVGAEPRYPRNVEPDPRGHVLVHHELGLLDLDADGVVVKDTGFDAISKFWRWGGIDAAGNWFVSFVDDDDARHRRLRKFDVDAVMLWEVDLGPEEGHSVDLVPIAVAADGSTVVQEFGGELIKHDPDGVHLWTMKPDGPLRIEALNDAGDIFTLHTGGEPGPQMLTPEGTTAWQTSWPSLMEWHGRADMNEAGAALVGSAWVGVQVMRFAHDGAVVWERDFSHIKGSVHYLAELAINGSGEAAIGGRTLVHDNAVVIKVDGEGEVVASHYCSSGSVMTTVMIDDAGAVYAAGFVDEESQLPFVAVYD